MGVALDADTDTEVSELVDAPLAVPELDVADDAGVDVTAAAAVVAVAP